MGLTMNKLQTDIRTGRTKKWLRRAFIELLMEKPLDKITVNDLTQRAEINRATFYLHYRNREDFIERFIDELFMDLETIFSKHYNVPFNKEIERSFLEEFFGYIAEHKKIFQSLLVSKRIPYFTQLFIEMFRNIIAKRYDDHLEPNIFFKDLGVETDIVSWYITSALIGTISMWLGSDLKYSPEYMAKQIMKLNPIRAYID